MKRNTPQTTRQLRIAILAAILSISTGVGLLTIAQAQTFRGSVVGLITDAGGSVVTDARVTLTEIRTGLERVTATNSTGNYTFADVTPGVYKITVEKPGFKALSSSNITVATQQTARFDATCEVGEISQRVDVQALAPTINTENAQLGDIRTRDDLVNLPLNSRGTMDFRYVTSSNYEGGYLGGQRSSFGFYSVDGVSAMAPAWGGWSGPTMLMSLEGVQEIKLVTSSPSAEFGDAATVYVSTRSGTNDLHGSSFYEHSNHALNARNFFAAGKPKGPILHEFGGSLGGPVYIPKLYNGKNRTFFFFAYEGRRQPAGFSGTASVPTLRMRAGDFSELLPDTTIIDPTTGQPFPGNIIPTNRLSPVALRMQDPEFMPLPNFGPSNDFFANFRAIYPDKRAANLYTIRLDHNLRGQDTLSARVNFRRDNEPRQDSDLPAFRHNQFRDSWNTYISETHLFSPTLVNEFRAGYARDYSPIEGAHKGAELVERWGLQGLNLANKRDISGVPYINWSNFSGYYELTSYYWAQETYEFLDNLTWTRGRHVIKAGGLLRRYRTNSGGQDSFPTFGSYTFDGFATGFDYADFLLGIPQQTGRFEPSPARNGRYGYLAGYFQDDWRVSPKLTLNFGLRYEYGTPPTDKYDMRFAFDPRTGNLVVPDEKVLNTLVNPLFPKSIPIVTAQAAGFPSRSLVRGDRSNWGPRIGFAYRPIDKTVIRAGYGVYYTPLTWPLLDPFSGGPFRSEENFNNRITNGVPLFQFPSPFAASGDIPTQSVTGVVTNPRTPYTQQWNLTVERELPHAIVARINYRGHRTLQILYAGDINKPLPSANPANADFFRYPNFYEVTFIQNGGSQIGNLLEVEVERKFSQGLTFQAGWTLAKVLTDVPDSDVVGWIENPYDRRREWGNENGVTRHRAVAYATYELPFGAGKRFGANLPGWVQQTFGNWQISNILVLQSGRFFNPSVCCPDTSNTRTYGGRPDLVGEIKVSNPTIARWFNPAAFATPPNGRFGTSARAVIEGPGLVNYDFGLFKYFRFMEKARLQLRMTATNFFNHPNFGGPNTNIASRNVGRISSTNSRGLGGGARVIKLGLRFEF